MALNDYGWFLDGQPQSLFVVSTGPTGEGSGSGNTAWDALDNDPLWTLSVSNTVATSASAVRAIGVRTVSGKTRGKHYVEITPTGDDGGDATVSLVTLGPTWLNVDGGYLGIHCYANFDIYYSGTTTGISIGGWVATDVISIAADFDNGKVWFRKNGGNWNGNASYDPATNVGGISISSISGYPWYVHAYTHLNQVTIYTANFGNSAFTYTVPSGFTPGWSENTLSNGAAFSAGTIVGGLTLANSDYTVDGTTASAAAFVRSATAKSTGKYCFEYFIGRIDTTASGVGLVNSSAGATFGSGSGANGVIVYTGAATGSIYVNGVLQISHSSLCFDGGSIVQIAVDLDADLFWARVSQDRNIAATTLGDWNGDAAANPATGVGGFSIAALGASLYPAVACTTASTQDVSLSSRTVTKLDAPSGFTIGWAA